MSNLGIDIDYNTVLLHVPRLPFLPSGPSIRIPVLPPVYGRYIEKFGYGRARWAGTRISEFYVLVLGWVNEGEEALKGILPPPHPLLAEQDMPSLMLPSLSLPLLNVCRHCLLPPFSMCCYSFCRHFGHTPIYYSRHFCRRFSTPCPHRLMSRGIRCSFT